MIVGFAKHISKVLAMVFSKMELSFDIFSFSAVIRTFLLQYKFSILASVDFLLLFICIIFHDTCTFRAFIYIQFLLLKVLMQFLANYDFMITIQCFYSFYCSWYLYMLMHLYSIILSHSLLSILQ